MSAPWTRPPDAELERALDLFVERLADRPISVISHHGMRCCAVAKAWLLAAAASQPPGDRGLAWIGDRWRWGPHAWPLHWCEIVARDRLDCGALAALAFMVLEARGRTALPVQLVEEYDQGASGAWGTLWTRALLPSDWLHVAFAYHEAVATLDAGHLSVWDPTDGRRIDRGPSKGYGAVRAIRVHAASGGAPVQWRGMTVPPGVWWRA